MEPSYHSKATVGTQDSRFVSFAEAAYTLGLDSFTFYALVQRENIPAVIAANGEFVVTQDTLDNLTGKGGKTLC